MTLVLVICNVGMALKRHKVFRGMLMGNEQAIEIFYFKKCLKETFNVK